MGVSHTSLGVNIKQLSGHAVKQLFTLVSLFLACGCASHREAYREVSKDYPVNMVKPGDSRALAAQRIGERYFEWWKGKALFDDITAYGVPMTRGDRYAVFVFENDVLLESKPMTLTEWVRRVNFHDAQATSPLSVTAQRILAKLQERADKKAAEREKYIASKPSLDSEFQDAIRGGRVRIGMSTEDVAASWGEPRRKNMSGGAYGKHEQWVYLGNKYLYFENGKLTSWQYSKGDY